VFLTEVLGCACGGTRRVISSIDEGVTARKIPEHLGFPFTPPQPCRVARRRRAGNRLVGRGPIPVAVVVPERVDEGLPVVRSPVAVVVDPVARLSGAGLRSASWSSQSFAQTVTPSPSGASRVRASQSLVPLQVTSGASGCTAAARSSPSSWFATNPSGAAQNFTCSSARSTSSRHRVLIATIGVVPDDAGADGAAVATAVMASGLRHGRLPGGTGGAHPTVHRARRTHDPRGIEPLPNIGGRMSLRAQEVEASLIEVRSPLDGAVFATVPMTPIAAIPGLIATSREASRAWRTLTMKERVKRLRSIRHRWLDRGAELAAVLMKETGKSEAEALMSEVVPSIDLFEYWLKAAPDFLAREKVALNPLNFPGKRGYIDYEPRGVLALITPWNYPSSIPLRALVPALLAGNGVVWKPSELAPLSSKLVFDIFAPDLPPGLLALVQGDGKVGEALVDAEVDGISFTGSAAIGKRIAQRAAARLIPVSLELGGKNAAIVLEDADLDRASAGVVWGAFSNAGQNCAAVSRVYVVKDVAAPFEQRVRARIAKIATGKQAGANFDVGPVISEKQLERVTRHVGEATAAGTAAWSGGRRADEAGYWFEPTCLVAPAKELAVAREETFGPAFSVVVVADEAEAVQRANEGDYGLSASIWTRDLKRGERLAHALDVGTVTVNNTSFTPVIPNAPWSGRRSSGHGTTNSHRALSEMVQPRFVLLDKSVGGELWWFPHDQSLVDIGRAMLDFLHRSLFRKLRALPVILGRMPARLKALKKPVL
jgi:acyl-CoA reductase-like NAD-dependent aldehyde dehydrogenase